MDLLDIRISAQRALWGNVPRSLRAYSAEVNGEVVRLLAVFDSSVSDVERELLTTAGAEVMADYPESFGLEEELLVMEADHDIPCLQHLIFRRYEL